MMVDTCDMLDIFEGEVERRGVIGDIGVILFFLLSECEIALVIEVGGNFIGHDKL